MGFIVSWPFLHLFDNIRKPFYLPLSCTLWSWQVKSRHHSAASRNGTPRRTLCLVSGRIQWCSASLSCIARWTMPQNRRLHRSTLDVENAKRKQGLENYFGLRGLGRHSGCLNRGPFLLVSLPPQNGVMGGGLLPLFHLLIPDSSSEILFANSRKETVQSNWNCVVPLKGNAIDASHHRPQPALVSFRRESDHCVEGQFG